MKGSQRGAEGVAVRGRVTGQPFPEGHMLSAEGQVPDCTEGQTKSVQHRETVGLDQPRWVLSSSKSDVCTFLVRLNIMVPFKYVRIRLPADENLSSVLLSVLSVPMRGMILA